MEFEQKQVHRKRTPVQEEEYKGLKAKAAHAMLKGLSKSVEKESDILWNFTKFLIASDGKTVLRYAPTTDPVDIEKDIEKLLKN